MVMRAKVGEKAVSSACSEDPSQADGGLGFLLRGFGRCLRK